MNYNYNVIIVDDEQPARKLLENYISKVSYLSLLGSYKSPLEALPILQENKVHILLLDIRMPEISGLSFLKILEKSTISVIITTAYREYALEGYEYDVVDYLLKPIEFPRFLNAIDRVVSKEKINTNKYFEPNKEPEKLKFIHLKSNKRLYKVSIDSILYLKGENEYIFYFLKNEKKILIYGTLKEAENSLSLLEQFSRVHRSYIVNLNEIDYVEGNQLYIHGNQIPISNTYKKSFLDKWSN